MSTVDLNKKTDSRKSTYYVRFDPVADNYPEAYFHYCMGYMLPGLLEIIRHTDQFGTDNCHFIIQKYGDVMDEKFEELLLAFNISYGFSMSEIGFEGRTTQIIHPARWDVYFSLKQYFLYAPIRGKMKLILDSFRSSISRQVVFSGTKIKTDILELRARVLKQLKTTAIATNYLLLDRVRPNAKYDRQLELGSGYNYGHNRRALTNLEAAVKELSQNGREYEIYLPGDDGFIDQVKKFSRAAGIVTIRGAELANILWMKEGAEVIVIDNFETDSKRTSPAIILAQICALNYKTIKIEHMPYPALEGKLLKQVKENFEG